MVSAVGVVFLGSLGWMPDGVIALFGQVLMALGNFGRQYALRSLDAPVSRQWTWSQAVFNLTYLLLNGWLFLTGATYGQMMLVFFAFYAINCLEYFRSGQALRRQRGLAGARTVQWSGVVLSVSLAIKWLSLWGGWGAAGLYDPGWDQLVLFAGQFLGISLMNFGFMQMLVHQFQQQRAQAAQDLLVQRERTAKAEQQSLDLSQLLREREEIIRQLTLSNKTAGMGALVSNIAHEINQPLATIVLKTELIESYMHDPAGEAEMRRLCAQIREDTHRAGTMIRTLRGMFSISRGDFGPLDFADMLRDMVSMVRGHAERLGIALDLSAPATLKLTGDLTQLQQVVLNLLNNAIDAVSKPLVASARIVVDCRLNDGWLELAVKDNGRGIDPGLKEDIFALFKSPASQGMGVGLWLSQAVVQSHGGTLVFESESGRGTVFLLRLPGLDQALVH